MNFYITFKYLLKQLLYRFALVWGKKDLITYSKDCVFYIHIYTFYNMLCNKMCVNITSWKSVVNKAKLWQRSNSTRV